MKTNRKKKDLSERHGKIFVAMSGGVDSSVAAALLKERGFDVRGVHMKMWSDPSLPCTAKEDRLDAMRAAAHLGISFETWDFTDEYRRAVVEYMVREYAVGRTPNPDIMCNRHIKFGLFLRESIKRGADFIATGHYVKIQKSKFKNQNDSAKFKILQSKDLNKDQSYFLWTLIQKQLRHCLFPIGDYTKKEVRAMAQKFGLPNAEKPDSQGVCFIGEFDMREFLQRYIFTTPGVVKTTAGRVVGEHEGLPFYTVGQRQGIGIGGGIPYYVAQKDFKTNTLVVAEGPYDGGLFKNELTATGISWISGKQPKFPLKCEARIRYRQPLQKAKLFTIQNSKSPPQRGEARPTELGGKAQNLRVVFNDPQRAITPGQSIVFYEGEEMLGGGVIV